MQTILILLCLMTILHTGMLFFLLIRQHKHIHISKQMYDLLLSSTKEAKVKQREELIEEQRTHLLLLCYRIRETVAKQTTSLHPLQIERTPRKHGLTEQELAKCFNSEQAQAVTILFKNYREYVETYWAGDDQLIKTIFKGNPADLTSELGTLHAASTQLLHQIDQLLITIQRTEK
ncbi:hypothetical protein RYX45_03550 [Alkalihalophilus pseudofirmus]|uniref:Uncharacterized protein n=1 Tax=Alkalihalophilus pseudofirmus TaxID=79885 RepID=A0AAJ2NKE5_ALKPS|nr:hypothetical protein [Alkalihalophilus pseudofirmus]MDV2884239.1 hypothetical protein [Alkalihalophilus pseudofirmus]